MNSLMGTVVAFAVLALLGACATIGYVLATAPAPHSSAATVLPLVVLPPQVQPDIACAVNTVGDACTALLTAWNTGSAMVFGTDPPTGGNATARACVTAWSGAGGGATQLECAAPCDAVLAAMTTLANLPVLPAPHATPAPSASTKNTACGIARALRAGAPSRVSYTAPDWSTTAFVNAAASCISSAWTCG